jgi:hypothetical protein
MTPPLSQDPKNDRHGDEYLDAYFDLCRRIYERHVREGTWPWTADSTDGENMVDSEGNDDAI